MEAKERMNCTEFKKRVSELINITIPAEKKRFEIMSNRRLEQAGVRFKKFKTDQEIIEGWNKYNKKEAEWEKYCRQSKHFGRQLLKKSFTDYSHLAYNGVADDF